MVFGHEFMGVVEKLGSGVQLLKEGDRVSLPFNIACGSCFNCCRGQVDKQDRYGIICRRKKPSPTGPP